MKMKSFSIKNFRSIKDIKNIELSNYNILVGPNNAGKSNILSAISIANQIIKYSTYSNRYLPNRTISVSNPYKSQKMQLDNWSENFHVQFGDNAQKTINFTITFTLNSYDKTCINKLIVKEFLKDYYTEYADEDSLSKIKGKIEIKNNMVLKITMKKNGMYDILIYDSENMLVSIHGFEELMSFINKNTHVEYIPAIRSNNEIMHTIDDAIGTQLQMLKRDEEYNRKINELEKIQQKSLDEVSKSITKEITEFLPQIKKIGIKSRNRYNRKPGFFHNVLIDDGVNTSLDTKGDGLKNLIAILIIRYASRQQHHKNTTLIIEEPESHLHPDAIHKLGKILIELSLKNQIIISTHSPILLDRLNLHNNIIVENNTASPAKNISKIRKILGVRIGDNLKNAKIIIIVEGDNDEKILKTCINEKSPTLKKFIQDGYIAFDVLNGTNNLYRKCDMWNKLLCNIFLFLDNDSVANNEYSKIESSNIIPKNNTVWCIHNDHDESEIEDFIKKEYYVDYILKKYGVDVKKIPKRYRRLKWSKKMEKLFRDGSQNWNIDTSNEIKKMISDTVVKNGYKTMTKQGNPIMNMITKLERYTSKI